MKRCPACDKTFADGMKFCQTDGTLLVEDAPAADPYKTVVADQNEIAAAIPPIDPFKTMVASPSKMTEEDILQLPDEPDALKTMIVSPDELKREQTKAGDDMLSLDAPPPPPPFAASAPLIEPKPASPKADSSAPKFSEPASNAPSFGDVSSSSNRNDPATGASDATAIMDSSTTQERTPSPFDSKPFTNDFSTQSPYGNQENKPIPSPFDLSMAPGYQPPAESPFDAPKPVKETDAPFGGGYQEKSEPSPFSPPSPFGSAEPFNQPLQQAEWTPPPAPVSEWQNQQIGSNTPFQPPGATGGQDQTLAVVSLVAGIVGILCCQLTAPVAVITGYLAKKRADENPAQYTGGGLALAGMITGGIGTLLLILVVIYYIVVIAAVAVNR